MIEYTKLKGFYEESQKELAKIDKFTKNKTKQFKIELLETSKEFTEINNKYPNLANRLVSNTYKVTLQKLIPIILKVKKNKKHKSKLLKNRFPNLNQDLRKSEINILDLLKKIKICKKNYEDFIKHLHQEKIKQQQLMFDKMEQTYPEIKDKCINLYNGILQKTLDSKTTKTMISMYKDFYDKKLSNHDASVKFGTHLVDKFIKPHLKK